MTRIKSILASVLAAFVVVPTAAHALDNDDSAGPGGCHATDSDGYDIPIHNGESVFVDGKIVTCRNGTVIITTAPVVSTTSPTATAGNGALAVVADRVERPPESRTGEAGITKKPPKRRPRGNTRSATVRR